MPDNNADAERWNRRYQQADRSQPPSPCELLLATQHLLPAKGRALDLACGLGGNSLFLASKGLQVDACDIAGTALSHIDDWATQKALPIDTLQQDIEALGLPEGQWDVITVSRYLYRPLLPDIADALRPGGLLFYQTFSAYKHADGGPSSADFLLQDNELLQAFRQLNIRHYREECPLAQASKEAANEVWLVAQKPL